MASLRPLLRALALALVVGVGVALPRGQDPPVAPDGRPGLGGERSAREYAELFRDPTPEQRELIDSWVTLAVELEVLRAAAERELRAQGLFRMCAAPERADLAELHRRFRELAQDPLAGARAPGPAGEAFARAWLAPRLRIRIELLARVPQERRELDAGHALLRAQHDGYVALEDTEAREIARRVDLAAALLRALRLDLDALGGSGERLPGAARPQDVASLLALSREEDPELRAEGLAALRARVAAVREQMEQSLFTPRLDARLAMELGRRAAGRLQAAAAREELRLYLAELAPKGAEFEPPPRVAELRTHERYDSALRLALEGLAGDPLDEELCYGAGVATDFLYARTQSRVWFDRFLALRGVRAHDHRTQRRELDERERYALQMVQSVPPLGR